MGTMTKKLRQRVQSLQAELSYLERQAKQNKRRKQFTKAGELTRKQQRRIRRIREVELPKAKRNAAKVA